MAAFTISYETDERPRKFRMVDPPAAPGRNPRTAGPEDAKREFLRQMAIGAFPEPKGMPEIIDPNNAAQCEAKLKAIWDAVKVVRSDEAAASAPPFPL